jgi:hypothetical protein
MKPIVEVYLLSLKALKIDRVVLIDFPYCPHDFSSGASQQTKPTA